MWSSSRKRFQSRFNAMDASSRLVVAGLLSVATMTCMAALPAPAHAQTAGAIPAATPASPAAASDPNVTPPASASPRPLIWTGATLFTLSYIASAVGATTGYDDDAGTTSSRAVLWVPVVGPFVWMGSTSSAGWNILLALDGLTQIGGLTLFVYGIATSPRPTPVRSAPTALTLSVSPLVAPGASGAALFGTF
jgi:hypothetical protein